MDDWLSGAEDTKEATDMYNTANSEMRTAGMELTNWHSNEKKIIEKEVEIIVRWPSEDDVFLFDGVEVYEDVMVTKRVVPSILAKIFDPLGFIASKYYR